MLYKLYKLILYAMTFLWLGISIFIAIDVYKETPNIIARNKAFVAEGIVPKVEFVEEFRHSHGRLPTLKEFNDLLKIQPNQYETYVRRSDDVPSEIRSEVANIDWSTEYVIAVWRGEWFKFYISDGDQYLTNNFNYWDAIINFVIYIVIGVLPLIGLLLLDFKISRIDLLKK